MAWFKGVLTVCGFVTLSAFAQEVPTTEEDLAKQTALLKAQQQYFDQLAATAKSQALANEAAATAEAAVVSAENSLQTAKLTGDLAVATAIKGSGLSAATGKDGTLTIAASDKMLLGLQQGSLKVIDTLSTSVCTGLKEKGVSKAFIAPTNFDLTVQKSVADVVHLHSLHSVAKQADSDFSGASLQFAPAAVAGAMVTAQYLAGGVQSLSKLFRSDQTINFTSANRQALFEQALAKSCGDIVLVNVEMQLRQSAASILRQWIPDMARFVQGYEAASERIAVTKASLSARRTAIAADASLDAGKKASNLAQVDQAIDALKSNEELLAKYKLAAASTKTYLSGLSTSSVYDSMVWGQEHLHVLGGIPVGVVDLKLSQVARLTFSLATQDASVTIKSTFSADKLKIFSTGELFYSVVESSGKTLMAGVHSTTSPTVQMNLKDLTIPDYSKSY
ncbi:MAG: hypothetical protein ACT4QA_23180 [Panacagrimonas sp.]